MRRTDKAAAARAAWATRRSAPHRAAKAEELSKRALRSWAEQHHFHLVLLDGPSGRPRTGIVDALLIKHRRSNADAFEVYAVQLKGGHAGVTPQEVTRLKIAADNVTAQPLVILHDATGILHFLGDEPV